MMNNTWYRTKPADVTASTVKKSMADGAPMSTKKRAPALTFAALRGRHHSGVEQDAFDAIASNVVAEVVQRATDSRVTPGLDCRWPCAHKLDDVCRSTRLAAGASCTAVVLACDEPSIPSQQSVGGDQSVELSEGFASELSGGTGKPPSLRVGEAQLAISQVLSKHGVLGKEVCGHPLMVSRHPTSEGQQEELHRQSRHDDSRRARPTPTVSMSMSTRSPSSET